MQKRRSSGSSGSGPMSLAAPLPAANPGADLRAPLRARTVHECGYEVQGRETTMLVSKSINDKVYLIQQY